MTLIETIVFIGSLFSICNRSNYFEFTQIKIEKSACYITEHNYSTSSTSTQQENITDVFKIGMLDFNMPNVYHYTKSYSTVLKLDFPSLSTISKAELALHRKSGNIERIEAKVYNYDPNNTFVLNKDSFGSVPISLINQEVFTIDLKSPINDAISRGRNSVYISLGHSWSNGYGEFYTDNSANKPSFLISSLLSSPANHVGSATEYHPIYPGLSDNEFKNNCYNYAMDRHLRDNYSVESFAPNPNAHIGQVYSDYMMEKTVANDCVYNLSTHHRTGRIISSYDSPIYSHEWRIAYRLKFDIKTNMIEAYHFLKQTSSGQWSDHYLENSSTLYDVGLTPETINWHNYNGKIIYFAISTYGED